MDLNEFILLVDDDQELTELLSDFLTKNGFEVRTESNGLNAARRIIEERPRLVVLDVMLPDMDGLSICRKVRSQYAGPILMLTGLGDDIDEVAGLETGADDYIAKPVRSRVLLARIRSLLRRSELQDTQLQEAPAASESRLVVNGLILDKLERTATLHGSNLELTLAEFELLWLLTRHAGRILDRDAICDHFKEIGYDSTPRTIDLRVSHLRRKMGDDPREPALIKTMRGQGYVLTLN
ncbi:response regulator transcription factor [Shewanella sp. FJAT-52076]|uniref:response regulator transcription factor n=1 Tax=Shewanella sp. FJAT-52076 TaxID=2864202 RepID=UPI001C657318|nr:response regulator transcription factor [Shewanella sp. FJAT-52076]QYJ75840.1 response regulator transcription factor [Shewanella sp. FJAT-52076]